MQCRVGCGACCIAPSITSPIPGMEDGKPAGVRCIQLTDDNKCKLFGLPERPDFCGEFAASITTCGDSMEEAITIITELERLTSDS